MKCIEIVIDAEEEQDTEDIFNLFVSIVLFMDGNNVCWRETTDRNKNKIT